MTLKWMCLIRSKECHHRYEDELALTVRTMKWPW